MKAVIFQHMSSGGPGTLRESMEACGLQCRVVHTVHEDISAFDALAPDVLLVMGGAPGVYQADDYPFLKQERRIMEQRLAAGKATIGICLGAQLMASALGARVYKGPQGAELGWFDLALTEAGKSSPVAAFGQTKIMQWHGDTFDLPADAALLASSALYPHQVFSYGRHAVGFQGHIEVTPRSLAEWFVEDAGTLLRHEGLLARLRHDTAQYAEPMTNAAQSFMKEWLAGALS